MKRILFFNASAGAAGDMFNAALFSLLDDSGQKQYLKTMNALGLPGLHVEAEETSDHDIKGIHMHMFIDEQEESAGHVHSAHAAASHSHCASSADHEHTHLHTGEGKSADHHNHDYDHHLHSHEDHVLDHHSHHSHHHDEHSHHHHTGLQEIGQYIEKMPLSASVKEHALAVFGMIANAEAKVHGSTPDHIHFHEVGTLDAIADVVGGCLLMEMLHPDQVVCSPVCTGYGFVHCMHGILPIPAPATALLLEGVPVFAGNLEGEFCTPTGAALLKYFADQFGQMPVMIPEKTGYGLGSRKTDRLNALCAVLGSGLTEDVSEAASQTGSGFASEDTAVELICSIDDMSGEDIGFALQHFIDAGALDAYAAAVMMKKSRPGFQLTVLVRPEDQDKMIREIFRHTSTLGIRCNPCTRAILKRTFSQAKTDWGTMRIKNSEGYGCRKMKIEHDDLAAAADHSGLSIQEIREKILSDLKKQG